MTSAEYQKEWRKKNPEKVREIQRRHYYKDVEKSRERNRIAAKDARMRDPMATREKAAAWREANREWRRAYDREYRKKNKQKMQEKDRRMYQLHGHKKLAKLKESFAANPEPLRARRRATRGIPEPSRPRPEYCECCGGKPLYRGLHVDHCHVTGTFRGWLCGKCNRGIGLLGDSLEIVIKAAEYLRRSTS